MAAKEPTMEGKVQSWVGFFSGWQNRWCLLESGVMTVAASADDYANRICLNIKNAKFVENPTDNTQFEVHAPDHDVVYFKTTSEPMRQCWMDCLNAHRDKAQELNVRYPGHLALLTPEYAHSTCLAHHDELMKQVVALDQAFAKLSGTPPGCLTADQARDIHRVAAEATHTCANYINILKYLRSDAAMLATPFRSPPVRRPAAPAAAAAAAAPSSSPDTEDSPGTAAESSVGASVPAWERVGHLAVSDEHDSSECASVIHHDVSSAPTSPPPEMHHVAAPESAHADPAATHAAAAPASPSSIPAPAPAPAPIAVTVPQPAPAPTASGAHESVTAAPEVATRAVPQLEEIEPSPSPSAVSSPAPIPATAPAEEPVAPAAGQTLVAADAPTPAPAPAPAVAPAHVDSAPGPAPAAEQSYPAVPETVQEDEPAVPAAAEMPPPRAPDEQTFFSLLPQPFDDEGIYEGENIRTEAFLNACRGILPVLDVLGPTTFAPVKSDISGNIAKLAARLQADPLQNVTLQNMVRLEMMKRTTKATGSATDALLWLKRALEFICVFLKQVGEVTDESLSGPAGVAYSATLSRYHGWMVRGIFSLAMKSVPYRRDFLAGLGPAAPEIVLADMHRFADALDRVLTTLKTFYIDNKLDDPSVV